MAPKWRPDESSEQTLHGILLKETADSTEHFSKTTMIMTMNEKTHNFQVSLTVYFHSDLKTFLKSTIGASSSCRFGDHAIACRSCALELLILATDVAQEKFL